MSVALHKPIVGIHNDPQWIIALWLAIHGGDPAPDGISARQTEEIATTAIRALAGYLPPPARRRSPPPWPATRARRARPSPRSPGGMAAAAAVGEHSGAGHRRFRSHARAVRARMAALAIDGVPTMISLLLALALGGRRTADNSGSYRRPRRQHSRAGRGPRASHLRPGDRQERPPKGEKVCFKDAISGSKMPTKRCVDRKEFEARQRDERVYLEAIQRDARAPVSN